MAHITVEGGPSNWRAAFEDRPGLAVTTENHDRLLAERDAPQAPEAAAGQPEEAPVAEAPVPRTPPRRPPAPPEG